MLQILSYLGPSGTYTEASALAYANWLAEETGQKSLLCPYPTISLGMRSVVQGEAELAVVPVENSIQGSVTITLDTLWQLDDLQIQQELVLPVSHQLLSRGSSLEELKTVYSHPQALAQCQQWLEQFLPACTIIPTNSTTEALGYLEKDPTAAAIAGTRASELYNLPILAASINDYPDNCTRFWVLGLKPTTVGSHISLAFSVADVPGTLVKPLQILARHGINLSRIESRPTKRSLGEYIFFIDIFANSREPSYQAALAALSPDVEVLKIFGNYNVMPINPSKHP